VDGSWQSSCPKGQLGGRIWLPFCKGCWVAVAEGMRGELACWCFEQQAVRWTFRRQFLQLCCHLFPLAAGGLGLSALQYKWMAEKPWNEATAAASSSPLPSTSASSLVLKGCYYPSSFAAKERSILSCSDALKLQVKMAAPRLPVLGWTASFDLSNVKCAVLKFCDHECHDRSWHEWPSILSLKQTSSRL